MTWHRVDIPLGPQRPPATDLEVVSITLRGRNLKLAGSVVESAEDLLTRHLGQVLFDTMKQDALIVGASTPIGTLVVRYERKTQ